ncbi:hypothetical protein C3486_03520 [Streptomyces sp. Ru73]|uniref:hypothetical protein n=1 Tax=Streptomyces sp. Ru73 TaxID=2080748 RepID=UPI000CDD902F|nr:hypothetical protein [Streptomyces sp. Ru73]POX42655.1 hypothetical protein C3486_03520 [Streptomyces sp. Ru73]
MDGQSHERDERTAEGKLLDRYPHVRKKVSALPEFGTWLDTMPKVEVDNETYWVSGGDQLKDLDQAIVEWIRRFRPAMLPGGE